MALSPEFISVAKIVATLAGITASGGYWSWRLIKNRRIVLIRKKLVVLGIKDPASLKEWMAEWHKDSHTERAAKATKILANEKTRSDLEGALCAIMPDAELEPAANLMGRLSLICRSAMNALVPFSLGAQDREILDRYGELLLGELGQFKTSRQVGEVLETDRESIKLERFVRLADYGEVWMASAIEEPSGRFSGEVLPRHRRVVHFLTRHPTKKIRFEAAKKEMRQLSEIEGVLRTEIANVGDVVFVVTEYVAGDSLRTWLRTTADRRVQLDKDQVMISVVATLAAAHQIKLCHALLSPERIVLTAAHQPGRVGINGRVKIADFWLSRLTAETPDPSYLAPERRQADDPHLLAKEDIFALGVSWYQFLTEESHIERPPYDFYDRLADNDGRTARDWIKRCLAYSDSRYRDAIALQAEMQGAARELPLAEDHPPMPVMEGLFDVSSLLEDYLAQVG